jgi:hypothetical protein
VSDFLSWNLCATRIDPSPLAHDPGRKQRRGKCCWKNQKRRPWQGIKSRRRDGRRRESNRRRRESKGLLLMPRAVNSSSNKERKRPRQQQHRQQRKQLSKEKIGTAHTCCYRNTLLTPSTAPSHFCSITSSSWPPTKHDFNIKPNTLRMKVSKRGNT